MGLCDGGREAGLIGWSQNPIQLTIFALRCGLSCVRCSNQLEKAVTGLLFWLRKPNLQSFFRQYTFL